MWPEPVAGPNGVGALFKPVFHVWGSFLAGLGGEAYAGEDLAEGGGVHFFDTYLIRQLGSPRSADVPLEGVREGWYKVSVEGSLTSDVPALLSLAGAARFNPNDTDPRWRYVQPGGTLEARGASLRGQPKFSGALVLNETRMGVQSAPTALVAFEGPPSSLEVGQDAVFSWRFEGLGSTTCTVDGRPFANDRATGGCVSPLRVPVRDTRRHRLELTMRDVCGATRREAMDFSVAEGWSTTATPDLLAGGAAVLEAGAPAARKAGDAPLLRSAAGGLRARGGAAAAAAAVMLAALLAVLLGP